MIFDKSFTPPANLCHEIDNFSLFFPTQLTRIISLHKLRFLVAPHAHSSIRKTKYKHYMDFKITKLRSNDENFYRNSSKITWGEARKIFFFFKMSELVGTQEAFMWLQACWGTFEATLYMGHLEASVYQQVWIDKFQ